MCVAYVFISFVKVLSVVRVLWDRTKLLWDDAFKKQLFIETGCLFRKVYRYVQRRRCHPTLVLLPGKIPWTEEPGGLQSMGLLGVRHD